MTQQITKATKAAAEASLRSLLNEQMTLLRFLLLRVEQHEQQIVRISAATGTAYPDLSDAIMAVAKDAGAAAQSLEQLARLRANTMPKA